MYIVEMEGRKKSPACTENLASFTDLEMPASENFDSVSGNLIPAQ